MADEDKILDLTWPLALGPNGRERTVEQGSLEDVQNGVDLVFTCPAGTLLYAPEFGRPELAFEKDPAASIEGVIEDQCPRVGDYRLDGTVADGFAVAVTSVTDYPEAS